MKGKQRFVKYLVRCFLPLAIISLLGACSGLPLFGARPEPQSCLLPCWYGITPGKTTYAEAEAILRSLPELRDFSDSDWWWGVSKRGWVKYGVLGCPARGTWGTEQGIVTWMAIELPTSYPLTLGEIVERYGPPESYSTYYITSPHGPPQSDYWSVTLDYFQSGFIVGAEARPERKGQVRPDLEVTDIAVFIPTTMEEYYRKNDLSLDPEFLPHPWVGFHDESTP